MNRQDRTYSMVKESPAERFARISKNLGIGFVAAVFTGTVSGLFLRLIMKIVAIVFPHMAGGFTFEGTFALLLLGIGFTLANSIVFTFTLHYLPKKWLHKGVVYGCISLVIYGIPFFLSNPDNDLFGPQAPLGIFLFSILFIGAGILLALLVNRVTNWVNQSKSRLKYIYLVFALLIIPAIVMSGGIIYEIFYELIPEIDSNF